MNFAYKPHNIKIIHTILCKPNTINSYNFRRKGKTMKKKLLAGLTTLLFLLTSIGIAKDWPLAQEDLKNSKVTGLYDNVTILQEQINTLTERLGRIETLHEVGDRFTDWGDGTIRDNVSGLVWLKKANCDRMTDWNWENAFARAAGLADGQCGLTDLSNAGDWRLPTNAEWEAFMSKVYANPALVNTVGDAHWSEGNAFTGVMYEGLPRTYWSSDSYDWEHAYSTDLYSGGVGPEYSLLLCDIWPVRTGYRFVDMGDGTIRDNVSGLIWPKKANCFEWKNWSDAVAAAALLAHGQCGLTDLSNAGDWRLPTKAEWEAFMSKDYKNPALVNTSGDGKWKEGDAFTGLGDENINIFWSISEETSGAAYTADVDGGGILISSHVYPWGVWPVRSRN
jgi:hypothetical protein